MGKRIYDDDIYDGTGNDDYAEQYRRQLERYNRLSEQGGKRVEYIDDEYDDDDYDDFDEDIDEEEHYTPPPRRDHPAPQKKKSGSKKSPPPKKSSSKKRDKEDIKSNFGSHKEEKKKKNPIKRFFVFILVTALLLFIVLQVLIWKYIGDIKKVDTGTRNYTSGTMQSDDVLNILLVGSDTRSMEERGRTDSIILLSIDKKNKKSTMTSFMRDTYVTFPGLDRDEDGVDDMGKINAANVYGGAELLLDTIEYNFDIRIDKYFYVDFFSFAKIVDAVGGIELDISDEEAQGMEDPMGEQNNIFGNKKGTDYLSHGGKNMHVNGNQALAYARLRYVGNADFERTQRQRTVISKIIEKAKTLNPIELNSFIETSLESLTTNYTSSELYFLSYRAPFIAKYDMESQRIPEDDTFTYGSHDGVGSTLDIDFEKAKDLLRKTIYS